MLSNLRLAAVASALAVLALAPSAGAQTAGINMGAPVYDGVVMQCGCREAGGENGIGTGGTSGGGVKGVLFGLVLAAISLRARRRHPI